MEVVQLHPASPALLPAPGQQLLTIPGCFPLLLLFGCRELFWSRDVNTVSGPTAGCCEVESGQAVSSVRREVSRGSCVLLPPESTSPGSRCSARSRVRGSMGGGHGRDELKAKQRFHNPLGVSSPRRANSKTPVGFASDLTSLTEASLQKQRATLRLAQRSGPRVGACSAAAGSPPRGREVGTGLTPRALL